MTDISDFARLVSLDQGLCYDDWDDYDATMARERRVAVLTTAERVYSSG